MTRLLPNTALEPTPVTPVRFLCGFRVGGSRRRRSLNRKPHSQIMAGLCPILFAAILAAAGCSRAPVVTIDNCSTYSLMNVVLSGSGFTNHIGKIPAGAAARLAVHPRGESGLGIAFNAEDRHIDVGEQGYFEAGCGYRVAVTVDPDLKVSVSSSFRSD